MYSITFDLERVKNHKCVLGNLRIAMFFITITEGITEKLQYYITWFCFPIIGISNVFIKILFQYTFHYDYYNSYYTSIYQNSGVCRENTDDFYMTIDGYYTISGEQSMIDYVKSTGPLSVCVDATDWLSYV